VTNLALVDDKVAPVGRRRRVDLERAKRLMAEHSLDIIDEKSIAHGMQLITAQGAILTVYDSGKCVAGVERESSARREHQSNGQCER
jgi:hypothetical protein